MPRTAMPCPRAYLRLTFGAHHEQCRPVNNVARQPQRRSAQHTYGGTPEKQYQRAVSGKGEINRFTDISFHTVSRRSFYIDGNMSPTAR